MSGERRQRYRAQQSPSQRDRRWHRRARAAGCGLLLFCLLGLPGMSRAELRTWTGKSGKTVSAEWVSMDEAGTIRLRTAEGREITIALWSLSLEDQAIARALREAAAAARREAAAAGRAGSKPVRGGEAAARAATKRTPAQEVMDEMSLARTDPAGYAAFVREYRARHRGGNQFANPSGAVVNTEEGLVAIDEAIRFLETARPVGPLEWSDPLAAAAQDHAEDIGPKGIVGHDGSDGSSVSDRVERHGHWKAPVGENITFGPTTARDVVVQLLVDDGVPSRGHRINIFQRDFHVAGVALGPHTRYRTVCIIDFAGGMRAR